MSPANGARTGAAPAPKSSEGSEGRSRAGSVRAARRWAKVRRKLPEMLQLDGSLFYLLHPKATGRVPAASSSESESDEDVGAAPLQPGDRAPGSASRAAAMRRASRRSINRARSDDELTARVKLAARFVQDAISGRAVKLTGDLVPTTRKQVRASDPVAQQLGVTAR